MTVKITTTHPWATLPNLFTSQIGYIAAPRQINDFHGGDARSAPARSCSRSG